MKRLGLIVLIMVLALLGLLFGAMNNGRVPLELAFLRFDAPIGLALVIAFVTGMLLGVLWRVAWVADLLTERGRLRRALRIAEARARQAGSSADVP